MTLKPGLGSLKVIENQNDTIQSGTHDFLLTFHSNQLTIGLFRTVSEINAISLEYRMKIANFSHPCVFNAPAEGVSLEIGIGAGLGRN